LIVVGFVVGVMLVFVVGGVGVVYFWGWNGWIVFIRL